MSLFLCSHNLYFTGCSLYQITHNFQKGRSEMHSAYINDMERLLTACGTNQTLFSVTSTQTQPGLGCNPAGSETHKPKLRVSDGQKSPEGHSHLGFLYRGSQHIVFTCPCLSLLILTNEGCYSSVCWGYESYLLQLNQRRLSLWIRLWEGADNRAIAAEFIVELALTISLNPSHGVNIARGFLSVGGS